MRKNAGWMLDPVLTQCGVCGASPGEECDPSMTSQTWHFCAEWSVHKDRYVLAQVQQFGYNGLVLFGLWDNADLLRP